MRGSREPLLGLRPLHLCRRVQCPAQLIELTLPGVLSARCGRWYHWPLWCGRWCRWCWSLRRSLVLLQPQLVQLRLCGCSTGRLDAELIPQHSNAGAATLLRRCHGIEKTFSEVRFATWFRTLTPPLLSALRVILRVTAIATYTVHSVPYLSVYCIGAVDTTPTRTNP